MTCIVAQVDAAASQPPTQTPSPSSSSPPSSSSGNGRTSKRKRSSSTAAGIRPSNGVIGPMPSDVEQPGSGSLRRVHQGTGIYRDVSLRNKFFFFLTALE